MDVFPDYRRPKFTGPNFKQGKVALRASRIKRAIEREREEDHAKAQAKRRDGYKCRWPHQTAEEREICRRLWKEAAHYKGKGMGGNKDGSRNVRKNLITFCALVHNPTFPGSIHAGAKKVEPLDPQALCDGPCRYLEKVKGKWVEVGRESHPGVLMRVSAVRDRSQGDAIVSPPAEKAGARAGSSRGGRTRAVARR